jgi:uroporphyrinogen decarboxylase
MSALPPASRTSEKRQPNFENFRRTILRQGPPGPVPFVEFMTDPGMVGAVLGEELPAELHSYLEDSLVNVSADDLRGLLKAVGMYVRFCHEMGYDYVFMISGLEFRTSQMALADTASALNWPGGVRYWRDLSSGPIQNWQDFEAYAWPRAEEISYAVFEYLDTILPEGMRVGATLGGVFENATSLMGMERFSYALHDNPDLVEAICQRVGELTIAVAEHLASIDNVGMVFLGDDMGFYSGTLVSPDVLRRYVLPYNKKMAEAVHRAGKLFLLHSCGNMYKLMDDLIDEVGIDGKHSFEDKILPVEDVCRRWGDRIAVLGGVDMDLLGRGTEEQVRARTREILEVCGAKGTGYCLGTGNTAANYIPVQNYLAMLDEGRRWNREHFGVAWPALL